MRFKFPIINNNTDTQANFEQIQTAFTVPTFSTEPSNPQPGAIIYNSALDEYESWSAGTNTWNPIGAGGTGGTGIDGGHFDSVYGGTVPIDGGAP